MSCGDMRLQRVRQAEGGQEAEPSHYCGARAHGGGVVHGNRTATLRTNSDEDYDGLTRRLDDERAHQAAAIQARKARVAEPCRKRRHGILNQRRRRLRSA